MRDTPRPLNGRGVFIPCYDGFMNELLFQYCPKIVLLSEDKTNVLLARRKGEEDYDGTFSFIGGKTETTDESLIAGLKREKDEEIGEAAHVSICASFSCYSELFRKKDGNTMVLPHHVAIFKGGNIVLNSNEYAAFEWVPVDTLEAFEPKIENIPTAVGRALKLLSILHDQDFVKI